MAIPVELREALLILLPYAQLQLIDDYRKLTNAVWWRLLESHANSQVTEELKLKVLTAPLIRSKFSEPVWRETARDLIGKQLVLWGVAGYDQHLYLAWDVGLLWALQAKHVGLVNYYLARADLQQFRLVPHNVLEHYALLTENSAILTPFFTKFPRTSTELLELAEHAQYLLGHNKIPHPRRLTEALLEKILTLTPENIKSQLETDEFFRGFLNSTPEFPTGVISTGEVVIAIKLLEKFRSFNVKSNYVTALRILAGEKVLTLANADLLNSLHTVNVIINQEHGRPLVSEVHYRDLTVRVFTDDDAEGPLRITVANFAENPEKTCVLFTTCLLTGYFENLVYTSPLEQLYLDFQQTGCVALRPAFAQPRICYSVAKTPSDAKVLVVQTPEELRVLKSCCPDSEDVKWLTWPHSVECATTIDTLAE